MNHTCITSRLYIFLAIWSLPSIAQTKVQNTIILKTGEVVLTRQDWEKHLKEFLPGFLNGDSTTVKYDDLLLAQQKFIDYSFILAEAHHRNYYKLPQIRKNVEATSKYMMCKRSGHLFKFLNGHLMPVSDSVVDLAIEKSKQQILLSVLKFRDHDAMIKILKDDTLFYDPDKFLDAASKCSGTDCQFISQLKLTGPTDMMLTLQDSIFKLSDGQISAPLYDYNNDYGWTTYIILRKSTKKVSGIDKNQRIQIKEFINHINEEKLYREQTDGFLALSNFTINTLMLKELVKLASFGPHILIDEKSVAKILSHPIFTYKLDNRVITYKVSDLVRYFNEASPIRQKMTLSKDYVSLIQSIVINEIGFRYAKELGLTKENQFLSSQRYFENRIIIEQFKQDVIFKKVNISKDEIMDSYKKSLGKYRIPSLLQISILSFSNPILAKRSIPLLMKLTNNSKVILDSSKSEGLQSINLHKLISYDSVFFDNSIFRSLCKMSIDSVSSPFYYKNSYIIVKLEKVIGMRTRPFEEVKEQIKNELSEGKKETLLKQYLVLLKTKYRSQNFFTQGDMTVGSRKGVN